MRIIGAAVFLAMAGIAPASADSPSPMACAEPAGEAFGRSGEAYRGGCSAETERDFLSGYLVGRRVFTAELVFERARREQEEAGRHSGEAIDYHSKKADEALATIDDRTRSENERAQAHRRLEEHRQQILLIEDEFDWKNDRFWDAHFHLEQIKEGLDDWRKSEEHAFALDLFAEAQAFARSEAAIEFCSDKTETAFFNPRPYCVIRDGGALADIITGKVCVTGPSRATLLRRGLWGDDLDPAAAFLHSFNVFRRAENGRNNSVGGFLALFGADGGYLGVRCPEPEEWN